jgi:hypothetical protein
VKIGQLAAVSGVSIGTVRCYQRRGVPGAAAREAR